MLRITRPDVNEDTIPFPSRSDDARSPRRGELSDETGGRSIRLVEDALREAENNLAALSDEVLRFPSRSSGGDDDHPFAA